MKAIVKKNPLFYAFIVPALVDGIATLIGQGQQYWSVNRTVNEASPAYYFLLVSPWIFLIGSIVWFVFWYWLIRKLNEPYNLFFVFIFVAGHSWGSGSWIMKTFKEIGLYAIGNQPSIMFAWALLILYFTFVATIATYSLRSYFDHKKPGAHDTR